MKKNIVILIFALMLLIPFNVNAKPNVSIIEVSPEGNEEIYNRFDTPTFNDLTININGWFSDVLDTVNYKVTIQNRDNEDYEFADYDKNKGGFPSIDYSKSEYISYSLYCDDGYYLKANSTKECNLSIAYRKEVPADILRAPGGFVENNQVIISFGNDKVGVLSGLNNPKTASNILKTLIVILGIAISMTLIYVLKKHKKLSLFTLLLAITLIPFSVFAATLITIKINSTIIISDGIGTVGEDVSYFCYENERSEYVLYEYIEGMTWGEYVNSSYNTENFVVHYHDPNSDNSNQGDRIINYKVPPENYEGSGSFGGTISNENEVIRPKDEVCYTSKPL